MAAQKRRINELTAGEIDPVVQSLIPFVAALDREDEKTAAVVEAIESLFFKLKQSSVRRSSSSCACIHIQRQLSRLVAPFALRTGYVCAHQHQRAPSIATVLDLQELRIFPYGLEFKDDAARAFARQRGGQEVGSNFLTLVNTKALISLVRKHMSTAVRRSLAHQSTITRVLTS